jgi:hypothetical protein
MEAVSQAEFVPALLAGKPVAVTMTFRVVISHAGSTCEAQVIPNPGMDENASDAADVAPQRIDREGGWFALRPVLELRTWAPTAGKGWLFLGSVGVGPDGSPGDTKVELRHEILPASQAAKLTRSLGQSSFIPGYRGGQPVAMRYFHWVVSQ